MLRTVLIVEDADQCATTLEIAISAIPRVSVALAADADQALRYLGAPDSAVSAVVTDLNLPTMDGFEFIERLRLDRRWRDLPLVVVSGDNDPRTPERVLRLGADAFFAKPYSPAQVRHKLEELLNAKPPKSLS
jgi:two-component system chemotaxis response regulator CheY